MRSTSDRRLAIRDFISQKRDTTIKELCQEFGVCKNTIRNDLDAITATTSFYMTPGNGGGIHATDGWYASSHYLSAEQEAFLRKLMPGLQTDDRAMMDGILAAFGMPKAEK